MPPAPGSQAAVQGLLSSVSSSPQTPEEKGAVNRGEGIDADKRDVWKPPGPQGKELLAIIKILIVEMNN